MAVLTSVPLNQFLQLPQQSLLAYPQSQVSVGRITELHTLGVTAINNMGPKQVKGWSCLGLGYCGLVLSVHYQGRTVALKVRRTDAPRPSFAHETAMLTLANTHQVGPQYLGSTENFLLMECVVGEPLLVWLATRPTLDLSSIKNILIQLLQQAFQLDQAGLDHGNLRCVTQHAIVTSLQPTLLDFSSASTTRRPANVTSLTQGLFWGTKIAQVLVSQGFRPNKPTGIAALRDYKHHPTKENFNQILDLHFDDK